MDKEGSQNHLLVWTSADSEGNLPAAARIRRSRIRSSGLKWRIRAVASPISEIGPMSNPSIPKWSPHRSLRGLKHRTNATVFEREPMSLADSLFGMFVRESTGSFNKFQVNPLSWPVTTTSGGVSQPLKLWVCGDYGSYVNPI